MSARILDGRAIARVVRAELKERAAERARALGHPAGLAIVHVGDHAASEVYRRRLAETAAAVGVGARVVSLPEDIKDAELRAALAALNADERIQGILMELPLPEHLSARAVAETLDAAKDVDGISLVSGGNLFLRLPTFVPSTCAAVLEILDRSEIALAGRRAVVVGASDVVGKPLALLLLGRDATVTICHRATRNLASWTRQAEVLVVAVGKAGLITGDMVRPGATVVDVGINVGADGQVVGDVEFDGVSAVAGAITPVPGGVGPLTNLMLLAQCVAGPRLLQDGDGAHLAD
jgi:methylenetetrahydrofolate dehydrogenase (NADP+)/methenyltetrahydrofolate cyclohydrolase